METTEVTSYLSDESGMPGSTDVVFLPQDLSELQKVFHNLAGSRRTVTVQGSRTGLCGGAVPQGSAVINLSQMDDIVGFTYDAAAKEGSITVLAGCTLEKLNMFLLHRPYNEVHDEESRVNRESYCRAGHSLWFLPNPTEATATIGGLIATGATGSRVCSGRRAAMSCW